MPRRKHWTQTKAGKAKLAQSLKKSWAARKSTPNTVTRNSDASIRQEEIPTDVFAYALGFVECWIDTFAKGAHLPPELLARQLGAILSIKSKR
jgi:hypothetical protein